MSTENKKYFCYELFKNIAIWSKNGVINYTPCSYSTHQIMSSNEIDLEKVWNSEEHNRLKNLVEQDKPIPGCEACYADESSGLTSRRLGVIKLYKDYLQDSNLHLSAPQSIDYSVGNLCNLRCAICGPDNSTAWNQDFIKLYPKKIDLISKFEKANQIKLSDPKYLSNLKNIHFHGGGEPLLTDTHTELLKQIKEVKGLSDVHVFYNTNATQTVSQAVLDLWAECKLVELYFSIDDIGDRFDYQRTGSSWTQVKETIQWLKLNMPVNHMFKINCTWSFLNLFYLDELVDWYQQNLATNRLGDPVNLIFQKAQPSVLNFTVDKITPSIYDALINKYANYPQLLEIVNSIPVGAVDFSLLWSEIHKLDTVRNNKFEILCPEASELLK